MAETTDKDKPMIWKELVLGFVVVESCVSFDSYNTYCYYKQCRGSAFYG